MQPSHPAVAANPARPRAVGRGFSAVSRQPALQQAGWESVKHLLAVRVQKKRVCLDGFVLLHLLRLEAPARAQTVGPWRREERGMFKSQLLTVSGEF